MATYEESVFINCPFDDDYRPLFHALVFAVHDCGFLARCAWEVEDSGQPRIFQLYDLIEACKYGIHDISRTELNRNDLPRFNMPLELGIFLGAMRFGADRQGKKVCKVLDRERYRYQEFVSDIAGQDPSAHHRSAEQVITIVRDWLRAQRPDVRMPSGTIIYERYQQFQEDLPLFCEHWDWDPDALTFIDFRDVVFEWLDVST